MTSTIILAYLMGLFTLPTIALLAEARSYREDTEEK